MVDASLADRLARLTHLCSEINKLAKGQQTPLDQLQELLKEGEGLCRALRREIARRQPNRKPSVN